MVVRHGWPYDEGLNFPVSTFHVLPTSQSLLPASPSTRRVAPVAVEAMCHEVFQAVFRFNPEAQALSRVRDGVLMEVNDAWIALTGYARQEVVGRTALAIGHWPEPHDRERFLAPLYAGAPMVDGDVILAMQDGNPRVVRTRATRIQAGGETYILLSLRDVTEERMATEALRAGEQALETANDKLNRQLMLHELTESLAKVGHWVVDADDAEVLLSRGAANIAGMPHSGPFALADLKARFHPDDLPLLERAARQVDGAMFEYRWLRPEGDWMWARARFYRQIKEGVSRGLVGVVQDVTTERKARQSLESQLAFIQKITRRVPGMVFEYKLWPDGRDAFLFVSEGVQQIYGMTPQQAYEDAQRLLQKIHPQDIQAVKESIRRAVQGGAPWRCEFRVLADDGSARWMLSHALPEMQADDAMVLCGSTVDITIQKESLARLQASEERFRSLSALSSDWFWEQDKEYRFVRIDGSASRTALLGVDAAIGKTLWDSDTDGVSAAQWAAHQSALQARETFHDFQVQLILSDGSRMWASVSGAPMFNAAGEFCGYLGTGRDISARKQADAEIERLAFFDALTGLPNRRLLIDRLQHAVASSVRHDQFGALLFIDLDNFKILNDTLGHHVGDLLLSQVAQRLQACVRDVDTVARLGGDEFVVMLEELNPIATQAASEVEKVAKKILQSLNQPFELGDHHVHSSPSIGVTLFHQHAHTVDELLKRADLAMYQAKGAGRNTLRFFDPEMQAAASARASMEADLREGLLRDEFLLYYQPVVDALGHMTGVEALLRWLHPERGLVSPGDFISVAEQTGLILPMGQWVLEAACAQLVLWSAQPHTQRLTIAVNVSARQFKQPDFSSHILDLLRRSGANPYRLKLELTESLLLSDFDEVIAKMSELRSIGVGFSLDDFGTGYSSMAYLKRLPLDQLKIDQSFVRDVLTDPNDAAIARTILNLASSLDLGVVAEGVETAGQRDFLLRNGCKAFQGYFFGRPMPVDLLPLLDS